MGFRNYQGSNQLRVIKMDFYKPHVWHFLFLLRILIILIDELKKKCFILLFMLYTG